MRSIYLRVSGAVAPSVLLGFPMQALPHGRIVESLPRTTASLCANRVIWSIKSAQLAPIQPQQIDGGKGDPCTASGFELARPHPKRNWAREECTQHRAWRGEQNYLPLNCTMLDMPAITLAEEMTHAVPTHSNIG